MLTDKLGRPWERLVHCGSELDVVLGMPSLLTKMRRIIQILDQEGDHQEAEKLGAQIWNNTQFVYYSLFHRSLDKTLDKQVRIQAEDLADLIEEFQQQILICTLGVTDIPNDVGMSLFGKYIVAQIDDSLIKEISKI